MSTTPRTDDQIGYKGSTMTLIRIEFAKQLELELNASNQRIKQLEQELSECNSHRTRLIESSMEAWGRIDDQEGSR